MKRWDLSALPPSTEKETPRAPHPDAPRVPRPEGRIPRVLFSEPECRAVAVELERGEAMGDHHVRERAIVQVVKGRVKVDVSGERVECAAGTLLAFERGERHSVNALEDSVLLLVLAPWPAAEHYAGSEGADPRRLPPNASVQPISPPAGV